MKEKIFIISDHPSGNPDIKDAQRPCLYTFLNHPIECGRYILVTPLHKITAKILYELSYALGQNAPISIEIIEKQEGEKS